jgi:hypothetical protein
MQQKFENHLTAAEVGVLWAQYVNTTLTICMLKYFLAKNEDEEIRPVIDFAQQVTQNKVQRIRGILKSDNYPVPIGFSDSDIDVQVPRLYSDPFTLSHIRNTVRLALTTYGLSLTLSSRQDVRAHYNESITEASQIDERALQAEQAKGLYVRAPYISAPEKPEFVQDSDYLGSFFGSKRPLNVIEIANILVGSQNNMMSTALLMGFAQTAESQKLREFFLRGKQISLKQAEILNDLLSNNDMPAPLSLGSYVTNSTVAPFSDKLMLQHTTLISKAALTYYGTGLGFIARTDISGTYARLMAEMVQYLEDAGMLMIKHKWMEQPPLAEDRRALVLR